MLPHRAAGWTRAACPRAHAPGFVPRVALEVLTRLDDLAFILCWAVNGRVVEARAQWGERVLCCACARARPSPPGGPTNVFISWHPRALTLENGRGGGAPGTSHSRALPNFGAQGSKLGDVRLVRLVFTRPNRSVGLTPMLNISVEEFVGSILQACFVSQMTCDSPAGVEQAMGLKRPARPQRGDDD